jgi:hypothetical protein
MRHYSGAHPAVAAQEQERLEAVEMARKLYDELANLNEGIQHAQWHPMAHSERAKRILVAEEAVERIEKLLAEAFSWRTKL